MSSNEWAEAEVRVDRAHHLYDQGRWAEAAAELQAAISVNPYQASWHFNLGLTFEAMEDYSTACKSFQDALEIDDKDIECLNCYAANATRLGDYAQALECYKKIDDIDRDFEPSYCNRIATYTEMGDHETAELMFYLARQLKPACPVCSYNIGNSLYLRGDYERALMSWGEALRLDPRHPQAHMRLAEAHWLRKELDLAKIHYRAQLHITPDDADVLLDYGDLLVELGEQDLAKHQYRKALKLAPASPGPYLSLGELALDEGKLEEAHRMLQMALRLDADCPNAHAKMAQVLLRQKRVQDAAKHLVAGLKHCKDDPLMLQEYSRILLDAHLTRQANNVLKRLVRVSPRDANAWHNLAVTHFRMDELDEGINGCRKALQLQPEYPLALYNLALAHLKRGETPEARLCVDEGVRLDPANEALQDLTRQLNGRLGVLSRLRRRLSGLWPHKGQ